MFKLGELIKHNFDKRVYGIVDNFNNNYITIRYICGYDLYHDKISYPKEFSNEVLADWRSLKV